MDLISVMRSSGLGAYGASQSHSKDPRILLSLLAARTTLPHLVVVVVALVLLVVLPSLRKVFNRTLNSPQKERQESSRSPGDTRLQTLRFRVFSGSAGSSGFGIFTEKKSPSGARSLNVLPWRGGEGKEGTKTKTQKP